MFIFICSYSYVHILFIHLYIHPYSHLHIHLGPILATVETPGATGSPSATMVAKVERQDGEELFQQFERTVPRG